MDQDDRIIRFDWAAKRILRDKANFGVLEGLVSVLTGQQVRIVEILESEGNQERQDAKYNRVDVMARNDKDELIIIEIQLTRQVHYLERILFGVGKALSEHISRGDSYRQVKKVYSISILYFDLGKGDDYAYHGQTVFRGMHSGKIFELSERDRVGLDMKDPKDIFPEYYLICVNRFDKIAVTPLDEWMDYLKNDHVRAGTTTPGLREAAEKLRYIKMSAREKRVYDHYIDALVNEQECLDTARREGRLEGRAEGRKEGLAEGREEGRAEGIAEGMEKKTMELARSMKANGIDIGTISRITGVSSEELAHILGR